MKKNIYRKKREQANLNRFNASEVTYMSESKIERIEYGEVEPSTKDVCAMSEAYNAPELCNYYCARECPIGKPHVPQITTDAENLQAITMQLLAASNKLHAYKDTLIDMTADGAINEEEKKEFQYIRDNLKELSRSIEGLQLWIKKNL